jgi:SDR family mycofactocin-dependent oxidoreductase
MGKLDGKVALITGAARGQGRSHATTFAKEGADVVLVDLCAQLPTVPYDLADSADLEETVSLVEAEDRRALAVEADVRDGAAMDAIVTEAMSTFGRIDIVCANAGISTMGSAWELTREQWDEMISVCLTGSWETFRASVPQMVERGEGGSLIATSSCAGLRGFGNMAHYSAAKHGIVGLMKTLAIELGPHNIRANAVCPFSVGTPMILNEPTYGLMTGGADPTYEAAKDVFESLNLLPTPWAETEDVSAIYLLLASDEGRFMTGQAIALDAGFLQH